MIHSARHSSSPRQRRGGDIRSSRPKTDISDTTVVSVRVDKEWRRELRIYVTEHGSTIMEFTAAAIREKMNGTN